MRNVALRLEYDGTDFVGSQWQKHGRTVQGELERVWMQLTQDPRRIIMSGRTDAGVHAREQVANVGTTSTRPLATLLNGLNALLPADIAVLEVWEAPNTFHARHSAIRRDYCYMIDNGPIASPLLRRSAVHVSRRLDVAAMNAGLAYLVGTHDFAALTVAAFRGITTRTCYLAQCATVETMGRKLIAIEVAANAFLQHMVRNIVGTVLEIGMGRIAPTAMQSILVSRDRRQAGRTAPAHGLYLMSVSYPPNDAQTTRIENAGGRSL